MRIHAPTTADASITTITLNATASMRISRETPVDMRVRTHTNPFEYDDNCNKRSVMQVFLY
jgi:hypothetical protein